MRKQPVVIVMLALVLPGALASLAFAAPLGELPSGGRVFAEPEQRATFVTFPEAVEGLARLERLYPTYVEVKASGQGVGWRNALTGAHDRFPILTVEVTNEASLMPAHAKKKALFLVSIHGLESAGREGALRVIEDLAGGHYYDARYREMLDRVMVVFIFGNPDGWAHEMPAYRLDADCEAGCVMFNKVSQASPPASPLVDALPGRGLHALSYTRGNGHDEDLNSNFPSVGGLAEDLTPLSEPETQAMMRAIMGYRNVVVASDIHGMPYPAKWSSNNTGTCIPMDPRVPGAFYPHCMDGHLVYGMVSPTEKTPAEAARTAGLASDVTERLNTNPRLAAWSSLPGLGFFGGNVAKWGTVADMIGYDKAGASTGPLASTGGLNAAAVHFEIAYSHQVPDNHYVPALAMMQVEIVRTIVATFMDHTEREINLRLHTGAPVVVVAHDQYHSNADGPTTRPGWHTTITEDDAYERVFNVTNMKFFRDVAQRLDDPGRLRFVAEGRIDADALAEAGIVVVPEGATLTSSDQAALVAFARAGGRLVLLDAQVRLIPEWGLVNASALREGVLNVASMQHSDPAHPYLAGVEAQHEQTSGYTSGQTIGKHPIRGFARAEWERAGGYTISHERLSQAQSTYGHEVRFGTLPLGKGQIVALGSILPMPTTEHYHPYGIENHSLSIAAHRILVNVMGLEPVLG